MPLIISHLHRNVGYCWFDFVSKQQLLRETDSRPITCIVRERQLRLHGHVARYPEIDSAHRAVSVRDNPVWRRPRGRRQLSWLEQVDESCQELLKMGRGPAWRLARRNPRVWRRKVGDATRPPAYAPFDWLIDIFVYGNKTVTPYGIKIHIHSTSITPNVFKFTPFGVIYPCSPTTALERRRAREDMIEVFKWMKGKTKIILIRYWFAQP